jgi:hypothetical protein
MNNVRGLSLSSPKREPGIREIRVIDAMIMMETDQKASDSTSHAIAEGIDSSIDQAVTNDSYRVAGSIALLSDPDRSVIGLGRQPLSASY